MDAQEHAERIARIQRWLENRTGHPMSVSVHTGDDTQFVATGPFLRLEEHPVSKGVFRALFDDSLTAGAGPGSEQYVAFGSELLGVETDQAKLVLDKGAQRVEILDRSVAVPSAEEVTWPQSPPVPSSASAPLAAPIPAPTPAPPQMAHQVTWEPSAVPAPPPAPPVPFPAPPAPAPSSQGPELQVRAPLWGNAFNGGRFSGLVTVRAEGGVVSITGVRSSDSGVMLTTGGGLLIFGALGLILGLTIASVATDNSDMGAAFACAGLALLVLLTGLALYLFGRKRSQQGEVETLRINAADIKGGKVRYDSNVGCLISLFLTPLVGLIVTLVQGRRVAYMTVPRDSGSGPRRMNIVLKTLRSEEGLRLAQILRG